MKLFIVFITVFIVTSIMDSNGYSLTSQIVTAGLIGAFLGIVDSANSNDDTSKAP